MNIKNKKIVIINDKIIIKDHFNYFYNKFIFLILAIVFGLLLKQAFNIGNPLIIFILLGTLFVFISLILYGKSKKKKFNIQEGYEYIIDKISQKLIIKKTEFFLFKKYEYSINENIKLKMTDNFDMEDEKPYFNLYIVFNEVELLIQQTFNENTIKKLVDDIIHFLNMPDIIIEDPKGVLFKTKSDSSSQKDNCDFDSIGKKEISEGGIDKNIALEDDILTEKSKEENLVTKKLNGGKELDDEAKRKILLEKIDEMKVKEEGARIPLLEEKYKVKVYDKKLIINVRRNYILFFLILAIFMVFLLKTYLVENTIILEREVLNEVNCEIKYNFLGIEKLETEKYVLKDLKDFIVENDDEGDVTYVFEYQGNKKFIVVLNNISSEAIKAIKSFLKDESSKKLIIKEEQHFPSFLIKCFLVISALYLITSSINIILKRKIQKIIIDVDSKKIFVTFKSIIKEEQEYPISILKGIEIRQISNKDYLCIKILNKSLNIGQIENKNNLYDIEMFISKLV